MKALMIIMIFTGGGTFRGMSTTAFATHEECVKSQVAVQAETEKMLGIKPEQDWYNKPIIDVKVSCVKLD